MMLWALFLLATSQAVHPIDTGPMDDDFADEVAELVLNGRSVPDGYRHRLAGMPPAQRLQALILLRRSGLLKGDVWQIDEILRAPVEGPVR